MIIRHRGLRPSTQRRTTSTRLSAVMSMMAVGMAACGGSSTPSMNPSAPLQRPHDYTDCGTASKPFGGDIGVIAGILWPRGEFPAGTRVTAYACIGLTGKVQFNVRGPATLHPRSVQRDPKGDGVFGLTISANRAGTAYVSFTVREGPRTVTHQTTCKVISNGTSWHFAASS